MGTPIAATMTTAAAAAALSPSMKSIKVHSGSYEFDDNRDFEFLKLLADEIKDDHVMVITEGLQIQKSLASSFMVEEAADTDTDMTEADSDEKAVAPPLRSSGLITAAASDDEVKDSLMIVPYSDDDDDDDEEEKSDSKLGRFYGDKIFSDDVSDDALFPDSAPKSANSAAAEGNSFVNAVFDDFTPKDQIWTFCELCGVVQDNQRILIKIHGCGHTFCNYCFEWQSVSQLGPEDNETLSTIKCPVESCFNEIPYDHCVALLLQHSLDNSKPFAVHQSTNNISDNWEFLDDDLT